MREQSQNLPDQINQFVTQPAQKLIESQQKTIELQQEMIKSQQQQIESLQEQIKAQQSVILQLANPTFNQHFFTKTGGVKLRKENPDGDDKSQYGKYSDFFKQPSSSRDTTTALISIPKAQVWKKII